jgi:hypothetical protein
MLGKNTSRKIFTLATVTAVWCVYSMVALAMPVDQTGEITVTGHVTVNGQAAVSNSTVLSGAVVETGANSSAVVSLGKLGRVEILADSNLTLNFSAGSITAVVQSGKARISNSAGVATTVTTKDTTVIADSSQADNFLVEVECSHTHIDTTAGLVTMRVGSNDKQVAAGTTAVAGNLSQPGCTPCLRPDSAPETAVVGLPWLILLAAGVVGVAVWLGTGHGNTNTGGGVIIISPTR